MFTSAAVAQLGYRVGWEAPVQLSPVYTIDADNLRTDSGLTVPGIYGFARVEHLYGTIPGVNQTSSQFNAFLTQMRLQAATKVLKAVFAYSDAVAYKQFIDNVNAGLTTYDAFVNLNIDALDIAQGWQLVVDAIRAMLTGGRMNGTQRAVDADFEKLKIELEGVQANGNKGLLSELSDSLKAAQSALFPVPVKKARVTFLNFP